MQVEYGSPLNGRRLLETTAFLNDSGLDYEMGIEFSVNLLEDGKIVASGSLQDNVLKCIAVSKDCQGEGLAARIVSELKLEASRRGKTHLFLYTKPENRSLFDALGFYKVAQTEHVLLMEDLKNGVAQFVSNIPKPEAQPVGAIIMNCNPFTNGHLDLITNAAAECGFLYIFVVSEEKSFFPARDRLRLVKEGTAHLPNVAVLPTGEYLISSATFPVYFIKEKDRAAEFNSALDLTVFAECFAGPLGITRRYVGCEPFCPVTRRYNRQMQRLLPEYGIVVIERPRFSIGGEAISASRVRQLLAEGRFEELRPLVPEVTYRYLMEVSAR